MFKSLLLVIAVTLLLSLSYTMGARGKSLRELGTCTFPGDYCLTCVNCGDYEGYLQCWCYKNDGTKVRALTIGEICAGIIKNIDGTLTCVITNTPTTSPTPKPTTISPSNAPTKNPTPKPTKKPTTPTMYPFKFPFG